MGNLIFKMADMGRDHAFLGTCFHTAQMEMNGDVMRGPLVVVIICDSRGLFSTKNFLQSGKRLFLQIFSFTKWEIHLRLPGLDLDLHLKW